MWHLALAGCALFQPDCPAGFTQDADGLCLQDAAPVVCDSGDTGEPSDTGDTGDTSDTAADTVADTAADTDTDSGTDTGVTWGRYTPVLLVEPCHDEAWGVGGSLETVDINEITQALDVTSLTAPHREQALLLTSDSKDGWWLSLDLTTYRGGEPDRAFDYAMPFDYVPHSLWVLSLACDGEGLYGGVVDFGGWSRLLVSVEFEAGVTLEDATDAVTDAGGDEYVEVLSEDPLTLSVFGFENSDPILVYRLLEDARVASIDAGVDEGSPEYEAWE